MNDRFLVGFIGFGEAGFVTAEASVAVASEAAAHLKPGQLYIDLTSSFPDEMKTIAALLEPSGAGFVDGAMMGALPV
jgi:3-hydroxyisobutyrate dehydrogenase-like beta-hydroxyacid dehydrogenase